MKLANDPRASAPVDERCSIAWAALAFVEDPELPSLTILDLGLIRCVGLRPDGTLEVGLSPTYVGCPASDVIRHSVEEALREAGVGRFVVTLLIAPPWSSDWITAEGRRKHELCGIAPPEDSATMRDVLRAQRSVSCRTKARHTPGSR